MSTAPVATLSATDASLGFAEQLRQKIQALRVKVLDTPKRRAANRRKPEELGSMLADVMTLIETQVQPALTSGHYPDRKEGRQVAEILRAVARELDA